MSLTPDEQNQPSAAGTPVREDLTRPPTPELVLSLDSSDGTSAASLSPVEAPRDPAWSLLDLVRLVVLGIVALILGVSAAFAFAHFWIYPRASIAQLAQIPLIAVVGQIIAYGLLLAYMYILVTRERGCPDFFAAIHWNWPGYWSFYLLAGLTLSILLGLLANRLPMPKNLPIDALFRTPTEAWVVSIFGVTLAPLMEELFFRGFLYPVLARHIRIAPAVVVTAIAFALLHGSQLSFSWGPVLVIFLVGMVLTLVRAYRNSVAASLLIHMAYNTTISLAMCVKTDGFRHLEKLGQ